jgi:AcrR family transcriptional regulator
VFEVPKPTWRDERRAAAAARILDAAWGLARENGLAGMSLRDLGRRLGMATTSVYSYFESKAALYDAMFADAWQAMIEFDPQPPARDLRTAIRTESHRWMRFSLADPVRFQLMCYRTIPGFEPSPESYEVSKRAYAQSFDPWRVLGPVRQSDIDLVIGMVNGLIGQQLANEPGGDSWVRLIDEGLDLIIDNIEARAAAPAKRARARKAAK